VELAEMPFEFDETCLGGAVVSTLERPKAWCDNEYQYARLTLSMYYNLNFADSRNRVPGVIEQYRCTCMSGAPCSLGEG
jgi:hypothetical protein